MIPAWWLLIEAAALIAIWWIARALILTYLAVKAMNQSGRDNGRHLQTPVFLDKEDRDYLTKAGYGPEG